MKQLESYTYTIPASGSVQIPAPNDNFYVMSATGPLSVRGDTFGRLRGMVAGQGLKGVEFNRLELIDESGAPNTVTILLTPAEFVNQVFSGSVAIVGALALQQATINSLVRPELPTNNWKDTTTLAANTPLTVFTAASNPNGAILWSATAADSQANYVGSVLIAKATAPATVVDGEIIAQSIAQTINASATWTCLDLQQPRRIAPGLGLFFIQYGAGGATALRSARYTLL